MSDLLPLVLLIRIDAFSYGERKKSREGSLKVGYFLGMVDLNG